MKYSMIFDRQMTFVNGRKNTVFSYLLSVLQKNYDSRKGFFARIHNVMLILCLSKENLVANMFINV